MALLEGKKTYVTGTVAIISAIGGFLTGALSIPDATQLIVTAILGMTIRNGINNKS